MCPFSLPVVDHCWMNCGCACLPIRIAATTIDSGTVTSAITASSGEIQNIIDQHADDGQQRREQLAHRLLQRLRDVVDVVGDPGQQLAARLPVEVDQRQPGQLRLDLAPHACSTVRCTTIEVSRPWTYMKIEANDVQHSASSSTLPTAVKSMPCPGTASDDLDEVGVRALAGRRSAATTCAFVVPAGQVLADRRRRR